MSKKAVIISGGTIDDKFVLQMLNEIQPAYVIGVDRGLEFLHRNHVMPTHIVGDFDSVRTEVVEFYQKETQVLIRKFKPEKDASDTEIALHLAIELGVEKVWIFGGTGSRLDHVMANIQILKIAHDLGIKAYLQDASNRISLAEKEVMLRQEENFGDYFSIFPFGGVVEDISIEGAKYPLSHYRLCPNSSMCVSNEMQEKEVKITFPTGMIILMETRDIYI
ncbi:MAG: thiamine diphosphokinase [Faecalimonas sp.]|nr:thiamine diphosphokinase [Faecalimonas sp.]